MAPSGTRQPKIFVSYSRKDTKWLERLRPYLEDLRLSGSIVYWDDTQIETGRDWRTELKEALNSATTAILLVSQDFLASKFIRENELPPLLTAAEQRGARIFPVIVSPCRFEETKSLSRFQAVNDPARPLTRWGGHYREVFVKLVREIELADTPLRKSLGAIEEELKEPGDSTPHVDVYLAVPMSSVTESDYSVSRHLAEVALAAFTECGLTVYCAALEVEQPRRFSRAKSALRAWKILDQCRFFVMVYPAEVASSVLVEAGYALHRKIPSVYIVREGIKLPFMLDSSNKLEYVELLDYDEMADLRNLIRGECTAFFSEHGR